MGGLDLRHACDWPRRPLPPELDLGRLLVRQDRIVLRAQALALGVTRSGLRRRLEPGGPWQRVLPRVYSTVTGELTPRQRAVAGLLHAGPGARLAGLSVLRQLRIEHLPEDDLVRVLVPAVNQTTSVGFVVVRRSARPGVVATTEDGLRVSAPSRAVADAAYELDDLRTVRAVVTAAVNRRLVTVDQLAEQLSAGPTRGSALLRRVVGDLRGGIRSAPEGALRDVIEGSALPPALYNVPLLDDAGAWVATPDAWWRWPRVAVEVDSRQYHAELEKWEATMLRHGRLEQAGYRVHVTPSRIYREPDAVLAEILQLHRVAA